jgi:hypothetical protein
MSCERGACFALEVLTKTTQVTCFCLECGLAQMNTELKDRSRKEHLVNPIGYQPQTQGMVYLPPNQQPQVQQATPQQPQLSEKKSTPQGV